MLKAIRQNMGRAVYFTSNANNAEMERKKKVPIGLMKITCILAMPTETESKKLGINQHLVPCIINLITVRVRPRH